MPDHTPNTCEPSFPHESKSTPGEKHVDELNFDENGKPNGRSSEHHTSKGWLSWGESIQEAARDNAQDVFDVGYD